MTFSRWMFRIAGVYGLLVLVPMYFMESRLGRDFPPPINHPEYFYGFLGVAVAWQAAFLIIAKDPVKYRPLMLPAILEKFSYGAAMAALFAAGRVAPLILVSAVGDLFFALAFAVAFMKNEAD